MGKQASKLAIDSRLQVTKLKVNTNGKTTQGNPSSLWTWYDRFILGPIGQSVAIWIL
jgi:hypothetical protein